MNRLMKRWVLGIPVILICAIAIWISFAQSKNVPSDTIVLQNLAAFLQFESTGPQDLKVDRVVILDGWADGLELNVQFTLRSQKVFKPLSGPLAGFIFNDGYTYKEGEVDLSYSNYGQKQWTLLAAKLKKVPAIINE